MKDLLSRPEASIAIVLIILCGIFQALNPVFLSPLNIGTMLRAMAFPGLIAVGMAVCLMSGSIDLSVGAIAGFSASLAAFLMMKAGYPIIPSLLVSIGISALIGTINCFVIHKLKIMAFIATIGMMYILRGLANWVTNGMSIYPIPEELIQIGKAQPLGTSWTFIFFVITIVILEIVIANTVWGLEIRATGSDRLIAKDTEVRVNLVSFSTHILLGTLAGIAGLFAMFRISAGDPTLGWGWEFQAILALCYWWCFSIWIYW